MATLCREFELNCVLPISLNLHIFFISYYIQRECLAAERYGSDKILRASGKKSVNQSIVSIIDTGYTLFSN